jgi:hypothetical protein
MELLKKSKIFDKFLDRMKESYKTLKIAEELISSIKSSVRECDENKEN